MKHAGSLTALSAILIGFGIQIAPTLNFGQVGNGCDSYSNRDLITATKSCGLLQFVYIPTSNERTPLPVLPTRET